MLPLTLSHVAAAAIVARRPFEDISPNGDYIDRRRDDAHSHRSVHHVLLPILRTARIIHIMLLSCTRTHQLKCMFCVLVTEVYRDFCVTHIKECNALSHRTTYDFLYVLRGISIIIRPFANNILHFRSTSPMKSLADSRNARTHAIIT